jgi:2-(1,2-epoxy-1,2-dihydrophenyl)acetyl-CoA isomerase
MITDPGIRSETRDSVGYVTLDRPGLMNRFEGRMREALADALQAHARDPAIRCVVIEGAGDAFSAGADVHGMVELHRHGDTDEVRRRVELGAEVVRAVRRAPKPVIAALDGVAAGAGANLALACDLRVGSERASLVESFVRIGLLPDWGGLHSLVALVGPGRAAELMMLGEPLDAARLLDLGILNRVFPTETFTADVHDFAMRLAAASPHALASIKTGIAVATAGTIDDVFDYERAAQVELFAGANCLEGMTAFLDRRKPEFRPLDP